MPGYVKSFGLVLAAFLGMAVSGGVLGLILVILDGIFSVSQKYIDTTLTGTALTDASNLTLGYSIFNDIANALGSLITSLLDPLNTMFTLIILAVVLFLFKKQDGNGKKGGNEFTMG